MRLFKLKCSFCRRSEEKVAKLAAGPRALVAAGRRLYICNECVAIASSVMAAPPPSSGPRQDSMRQAGRQRWWHLFDRQAPREVLVP